MKLASLIVATAALASIWSPSASAQEAVRPQFNYQGSAVCPDGYDYAGGLCRSRGYQGMGSKFGGGYGGAREYGGGGREYGNQRYGGGGGGGVEPRWNRAGSAVCPQGYDYHARSGLCRPQRY